MGTTDKTLAEGGDQPSTGSAGAALAKCGFAIADLCFGIVLLVGAAHEDCRSVRGIISWPRRCVCSARR